MESGISSQSSMLNSDELELCSYALSRIVKDKVSTEKKIKIIRTCIKFGFDINQSDSEILIDAVGKRDYLLVKFLIENGINVHAQDETAIYSACSSGNLEIVKLLIEAGADIKSDGNYPLQVACLFHHFDIIQYLLDQGASYLVPDNQPIKQLFCNSGGIGTKRLFLDNGADPNARYDDQNEYTILEKSLYNGDYESCQLLFSYGADINLCHEITNNGHGLYQFLINNMKRGWIEESQIQKIVDLFIEYGVNLVDPTLSYEEKS